ncbi:MAG: hypothetical protein FJ011_01060 [Chloroflexi bacterium]|nr:hypothetical protein [Chloroflexota bacterium]
MIGVQDFIGYYDWTFEYLRRNHGEAAVQDYWLRAISRDSQRHARGLIEAKGFDGMEEYWGHTLAMEEAGYTLDRGEDYFRIDMFVCPSKGDLIQRGLAAYHDYCEHCMGWVKPMMDDAGFVIDHEHNHAGQCYWEMRRPASRLPGPPADRGPHDVRNLPHWRQAEHHRYVHSESTTPEPDAD